MEDEVDIGTKGESWFTLAANNVGLRAHRPTNGDMQGWDHVVEHPVIPGSLFKGRSRIKSMVQVKTTAPKFRKPKIGLVALLKLVEADLPCFLLHLHHNGDDVVSQKLYHVDRAMINAALLQEREARLEIEKNIKATPLNKRDFKFGRDINPLTDFESVNDYHSIVVQIAQEYGGIAKYGAQKQLARDCFRDSSENFILTINDPEGCGSNIYNKLSSARNVIIPASEANINIARKQIMLASDALRLVDAQIIFKRYPTREVEVRLVTTSQTRVYRGVPLWVHCNDDGQPNGGEMEFGPICIKWEDGVISQSRSNSKISIVIDFPERLTIARFAYDLETIDILLNHSPDVFVNYDGSSILALSMKGAQLDDATNFTSYAKFAKVMNAEISSVYGNIDDEYEISGLFEQMNAQCQWPLSREKSVQHAIGEETGGVKSPCKVEFTLGEYSVFLDPVRLA